jgi:hypothetical protein
MSPVVRHMMRRLPSLIVTVVVSLAPHGSGLPGANAEQRALISTDATSGGYAQTSPGPRSLDRISSRADFDMLARTYYRGRFFALPHVMFVVDRQDHARVYYVNSKQYPFHKDFVNGSYLSLERGNAFYEDNYLKTNRRFILGTVAFQPAAAKFTFEFWEGDTITKGLLLECYNALGHTFYEQLFFKPNSEGQEQIAKEIAQGSGAAAPLKTLTAAELGEDLGYEPLNPGAGIGQLRIIDSVTADTVIDRNQIVIFKEVPVHLTPLSGIITTEPASPLSHINMLAKGWRIPNAYIKNADKLFKALEGKYVRLEVAETGYKLTPANVDEVEARQRQWVKRADLVTPVADLDELRLLDLRSQRAADAKRFGAKSANLGELIHAKLEGVAIPPGFAIPFHYYRQFVRQNNLENRIASAVEEDKFVHDPKYRKARLEEIRGWIQAGVLDEGFARAVIRKAHQEFPGRALFARSSTNSEDLPGFSGAGLYTTVPNVKTSEQLMEAIKTVWASVWNYEAYEARETFGMNHFGVFPAVLIQVGIEADSAGVIITADPFNGEPEVNRDQSGPFAPIAGGPEDSLPGVRRQAPSGSGSVYINAKRGLGMKVVEGKRVAEQVLYRPDSDSIQVLTRSTEDSMLQFDPSGGLKEIKIDPDRRVLTDDMVKRLAGAALRIKTVFGGRDQDIEWVYKAGTLYIVQSRPYISGS